MSNDFTFFYFSKIKNFLTKHSSTYIDSIIDSLS